MFKTQRVEATRAHILHTALGLFRTKGFARTTMRNVAAESGMSLGAAYYYFKSKEDIVGAYYEHVQQEHVREARERIRTARNLKQRLEAVLDSKLDILADDRSLMTALFRYGGDPDHPLCWFGPETEPQRDMSMALFDEALGDERLTGELRDLVVVTLWALHMGLILYMLFDRSPKQRQTRTLTRRAIELSLLGFKLIRVPLVRSPVRKALAALKEAGLVPPASRWRDALARDDAATTQGEANVAY